MIEEKNLVSPTIEAESQRVIRSFRLSRMILPVLLGIAAVVFLFYRQFDPDQFRAIEWTGQAFAWIGLALLILALRHLLNAFRLHTITGNVFSWRKCLELMVLWEFSAALTPTSKGGPFVMLYILTKEKLAAGRTAAAVLYTMVLDSGFFVFSLPALLLIYGPPMLYPSMTKYNDVGLASGTLFLTYCFIVSYFLILAFFLFIRPGSAKSAMGWLASRSFLQKWSARLNLLGEEFELAAKEIHRQGWRYHLNIILSTVGSWLSKFLMINCLIIALVPSTSLDFATQSFLYARMVAMFTIMTFSPTPGAAGLAEMALVGFTSDFMPAGIALVVALLWRGMSYYGYLLLGALIVPNWIATKVLKKAPARQAGVAKIKG